MGDVCRLDLSLVSEYVEGIGLGISQKTEKKTLLEV